MTKESQMEIVSDHLCHSQSKSLSVFDGNVRNQIRSPRDILGWSDIDLTLLLSENGGHLEMFFHAMKWIDGHH